MPASMFLQEGRLATRVDATSQHQWDGIGASRLPRPGHFEVTRAGERLKALPARAALQAG